MVNVGAVGFWKVGKTAHPKSGLAKLIYRTVLFDTIKLIKREGVNKAREEVRKRMFRAYKLD